MRLSGLGRAELALARTASREMIRDLRRRASDAKRAGCEVIVDPDEVLALAAAAWKHVDLVEPETAEQIGASPPWVTTSAGWAAVRVREEVRDQTDVHVFRVFERPGHEGPVTQLSTDKVWPAESLIGCVQRRQKQARALKRAWVAENRVVRVTARDHWDIEEEWERY